MSTQELNWPSLHDLLRAKLLSMPRQAWRDLEGKTAGSVPYRWVRSFARGEHPDTSPERVLSLAQAIGHPVKLVVEVGRKPPKPGRQRG